MNLEGKQKALRKVSLRKTFVLAATTQANPKGLQAKQTYVTTSQISHVTFFNVCGNW